MKFRYCSSPAGSGKTYQILPRAIRLARKGLIVLILQPTKELIDSTVADLMNIPNHPLCRPFHGGVLQSGKGVGLQLAEYLKDQADEGQIIFATHQILEHVPYWVGKKNIHLIVDEMLQVFCSASLKIADTHSFITDEFDVEKNSHPIYGRVMEKDTLKQKAKNKNGDVVLERFNSEMRLLSSDYWDTHVHHERFSRFMANAGEHSLDFYSVLKPDIFAGFGSVFMAAANFEETLLYKLWTLRGVEFVADTKFASNLRYSTHENGHLIDIRYVIEENWSKTLSRKPIDDKDVLRLMAKAAKKLFGEQEYVWHANKSCPDDLLNLAKRLPSVPHGLNNYSHINRIAFLSAINPTPHQAKFLECQGLSNDEIRQAMYFASAYQAVMRTSVRSPDSTEPVTILVPDRALAEYLADLFSGSTVSRLDAGLPQTPLKKKGGQQKKYNSPAERGVAQRRANTQKELVKQQGLLTTLSHHNFRESCGIDKTNKHVDCSLEPIEANCMGVFNGSYFKTKKSKDALGYLRADCVESFVKALKKYHLNARTKESTPYISPSFYDPSLVEDKSRGRKNIVFCRHIWLDIENGDLTPQQFASLFPTIKMVVTNTHRHTKAKPRFRVIILTDAAMTPEAYEAIMGDIVFKIEEAGYAVGPLKPGSNKRRSGLDVTKRTPTSLFAIPVQAESVNDSFFDYHDEGREVLNVEAWLSNPAHPPTKEYEYFFDDQPLAVPNPSLVDSAIQVWRVTPEHQGNAAFYMLGLKLKQAGLGYPEIKNILVAEAKYAHSPQKRVRQIPSIMNSLKKRRIQITTDDNCAIGNATVVSSEQSHCEGSGREATLPVLAPTSDSSLQEHGQRPSSASA